MSKMIQPGSTSESVYVFVPDSSSSTGGGKTGLAYNTASLTAYYVRTRAAPVAITLATLSGATASWSSGGFKEVDATNAPGLYRLDLPNAAIASGSRHCIVYLKGAAGMVPVRMEIDLNAEVNVVSEQGAKVYTAFGTLASTTSSTVTLPSADAGGNAIPDLGQHAYNVLEIVAGTGLGQMVRLTTATGTARQYSVLTGTMPTQCDATSQFVVRGPWEASVELSRVTPITFKDSTGSIGEALLKARAFAAGRGVVDVDAKTLTYYAPDGTTPVIVFSLDNVQIPTTRA